MSKLTDNFRNAYAKSQSMSVEEKNATILLQKLLFKKAKLPLIGIIAFTLIAMLLKLNIWLILGINLVASVVLFKSIKSEANKLNDFKYYAGNLLSVENKGDYSTILIKQGKMPIKLDIKYGKESFLNIKKNQFIKIAYNKDSQLATVVK